MLSQSQAHIFTLILLMLNVMPVLKTNLWEHLAPTRNSSYHLFHTMQAHLHLHQATILHLFQQVHGHTCQCGCLLIMELLTTQHLLLTTQHLLLIIQHLLLMLLPLLLITHVSVAIVVEFYNLLGFLVARFQPEAALGNALTLRVISSS